MVTKQQKSLMTTSEIPEAAGQPIVMTDWAANVERIARDRNSLLWELILHSLLREKILIQDEALAQSDKLALWFSDDGHFRLLEELIDATDSFVVIAQDPSTYPTDELQALAHVSPVRARAEYILKHSAKHGKPFKLKEHQTRFHRKIDEVLIRKKAFQPRKTSSGKSIHDLFSGYLMRVLTNDGCTVWLESLGINPRLQHQLASYIQKPENAVSRIRRLSKQSQLDPRAKSDPIFTRNLGHQLAATYPSAEAAVNRLIHSAYAAAFCENEGSCAGRYGKELHELLLPGTLPRVKKGNSDAHLTRVLMEFRTPMILPELAPNFAQIVRLVRGSEDAKELRKSLRMAGKEPTFGQQEEHWKAVADNLAKRTAGRGSEVTIRTVASEFVSEAKHLTWGHLVYVGALATTGYVKLNDSANLEELASVVTKVALGKAMWSVGQFGLKVLKIARNEQSLRTQLENWLGFRCVEIG
jgi:hypothetical protein